VKRSLLWVPLACLVGTLVLIGTAWAVRAAGAAPPAVPPVFGPNVRANSDGSGNGQHEPSLAVSRVHTNTIVVAQKDYRDNNLKHVWIESSTDGGLTWPANRQLAMPGLPASFPLQSDAVVIARDDGRIYVACLGYNNNNGVFITWTDDDGATWQNPSVQISPTDQALDDKDWFAVDNTPSSPYYHRVYMMYAPGANYVAEQHSTDGGLTWTARQPIGDTDTEYTYPVIGHDGTVYNFMMLHWGASQTGTIQLTKSMDGGATWTIPITVATVQQPDTPIRPGDQFRFFAILSAAVDPNTGALYTAWTDSRNFNTNGTDVLYAKSTNGGTTWTAPIRLSHDPTGIVRDHITPMLTVSEDSRLQAFWLDRRLDPANHLFDSWYSSSTDGGATWDPDTRVSTASQDLNVGLPPGSGGAAGDYWGLDATQNVVYTAWNDARDGVQQDIYVARGVFGGPTPTATPTGGVTTATPTAVLPTATSGIPPTATSGIPPTGTRTSVPATSIPPTVTASPTPGVPTATAVPPSATASAVASPSATPTLCPITFTDVQTTDYFYEPVRYLYCHGVISGYGDNTFRPYNDTTRAQMVKIVVLGFGYAIQTPAGRNYTFADVPPTAPFFDVIETAAAHNIVSGYGCGPGGPGPCDDHNRGYFLPNNPVTRGQLSKIDVIAAGWAQINPSTPTFTDVPAASVFYMVIETAVCHGVVSGYADHTFHPFANATRGQIAKIVYLSVTGTGSCAVP
jgi:hypothetical protein